MPTINVWNIYTEYLEKCTFLKNLKSGRHCTFAPSEPTEGGMTLLTHMKPCFVFELTTACYVCTV